MDRDHLKRTRQLIHAGSGLLVLGWQPVIDLRRPLTATARPIAVHTKARG
jgi:hypothetical protein